MNELYQKWGVGFLRHLLTPAIMWMADRNILSADESVQLIAIFVAFVIAYGGSMVTSMNLLRQRNTAAAMPTQTTPAEVKAMVKSGAAAPATAKQDEVPQIQETKQ